MVQIAGPPAHSSILVAAAFWMVLTTLSIGLPLAFAALAIFLMSLAA